MINMGEELTTTPIPKQGESIDTSSGTPHVYLRLMYPLAVNKYVTVGLFEERNYEVCVRFNVDTRRFVGSSVLLDLADWNFLMLIQQRITNALQQGCKTAKFTCEDANGEEEEYQKLKCITVKQSHVHMKDNKNNVIVFSASDWFCFASLSHILSKYVTRLFYDQQNLKSYIDQVVSTGEYVFPPSILDNIMYDRLYDELVMNGKAVAVVYTNDVKEIM